MDIAELTRQHEEIMLVAIQLGEAVKHDGRPCEVGHLRWQLARVLMTHLALEDRLLYPAAQRSADEKTRDTALQMQQEMGDLAAHFSSYMTSWSDDRILRDWPGFCARTRAILTALDDRVQRENKILYPMIAASARARPSHRKAS